MCNTRSTLLSCLTFYLKTDVERMIIIVDSGQESSVMRESHLIVYSGLCASSVSPVPGSGDELDLILRDCSVRDLRLHSLSSNSTFLSCEPVSETV